MSDLDARPPDLIGLTRASMLAERSERTLRRWSSGSSPKLSRWEGTPPVKGGPAPVLVSERELLAVLASSGQQPRVPELDRSDTTEPAPSSDMAAPLPDTVQVVVLEERLRTAELRAELATVTAERDGLHHQVQLLEAQVAEERRRWDLERSDHRSDLEAERGRSLALKAELNAVRQTQGVRWWQKLLGGPSALPALREEVRES